MDVKLAAELAELPLDEFLALNPQHNRPVIAGADEYAILLPIDNAEVFAAKLDLIDQPLVSWQAYRLKQGETLPQVAQRYAMSVETLMSINGIGPRAKVPVGHTLLVPALHPNAASADSLAHAVFTTVPSGRTLYHTVRRGDSLASVASRYKVSAEDVRHWNNLTQNRVVVGQRLRIVSDTGPSGKRGKVRRATQGKSKAAGSNNRNDKPAKAPTSKPRGTASAGKNAGG
jgi:membrane-bound lytic murein transglycosylase D